MPSISLSSQPKWPWVHEHTSSEPPRITQFTEKGLSCSQLPLIALENPHFWNTEQLLVAYSSRAPTVCPVSCANIVGNIPIPRPGEFRTMLKATTTSRKPGAYANQAARYFVMSTTY